MSFLTPFAAFLALLVVVPLAGFAIGEQRRRRVASLLRLGEPGRVARVAPAVAVTAVAGLLGVAAMQPTLVNRHSKRVRTDAEAFFVLDTSRSMLASLGPDKPDRFERARPAAGRARTGPACRGRGKRASSGTCRERRTPPHRSEPASSAG